MTNSDSDVLRSDIQKNKIICERMIREIIYNNKLNLKIKLWNLFLSGSRSRLKSKVFSLDMSYIYQLTQEYLNRSLKYWWKYQHRLLQDWMNLQKWWKWKQIFSIFMVLILIPLQSHLLQSSHGSSVPERRLHFLSTWYPISVP